MKKNLSLSTTSNQLVTEDNYQEILLEIIYDVIGKRKSIHSRYEELIKKVWESSKPRTLKTNLGKYLLTRLLRESDLEYIATRHPSGARAGAPLTAYVRGVAKF